MKHNNKTMLNIGINGGMKREICTYQRNYSLSFEKILGILSIYASDEDLPFELFKLPISNISSQHNTRIRNQEVSCEIKFQLLDNNKVFRLFKCDKPADFLKEYSFVELSLPKVLSLRLLYNREVNVSLVTIAEEIDSLLDDKDLSDSVIDEIKAFNKSLEEKFKDAGYMFYPTNVYIYIDNGYFMENSWVLD
ncbi:hypothetical protein JKY79_02250 [Candidatus Babeliales bacterium]|nr:hypothetical protein [Candidatus Babeliales bacterium]